MPDLDTWNMVAFSEQVLRLYMYDDSQVSISLPTEHIFSI